MFDGMTYGDSFWRLLLAALVFTIVNSFVKPMLAILSIPFIIVTLGIAYFFVNVLMLVLTDGWSRTSRPAGSGPSSAPRSSSGSSTVIIAAAMHDVR